jgi:hypothetical protein
MSHMRVHVFTIVFAGLIGVGAALAQTPTARPASQSAPKIHAHAGELSKAAQVEKWTTKQWTTAKAKLAREKVKWAECQHQSSGRDLTGRKSWAFLYDCMT